MWWVVSFLLLYIGEIKQAYDIVCFSGSSVLILEIYILSTYIIYLFCNEKIARYKK